MIRESDHYYRIYTRNGFRVSFSHFSFVVSLPQRPSPLASRGARPPGYIKLIPTMRNREIATYLTTGSTTCPTTYFLSSTIS